MGRFKISSLVPQMVALGREVHGTQACGCPPDLDPGQDRVRRPRRGRDGWWTQWTDPSSPRQARPVGRLLTEHREDGWRGGPAGAVTVLDAAVV